jgi:uncharacterized membrane protein
MRSVPKTYLAIFIIIAVVGLLDATYLTAEHLRGVVPPCTVVSGCDTVLTSRYAEVFGVPLAAFGVLYYGALLVLLIAYIDSKSVRLWRLACLFTVVGLVASIYFVALQIFVISAFCLYCLVSAGTSTLLFIIGMFGISCYGRSAAYKGLD